MCNRPVICLLFPGFTLQWFWLIQGLDRCECKEMRMRDLAHAEAANVCCWAVMIFSCWFQHVLWFEIWSHQPDSMVQVTTFGSTCFPVLPSQFLSENHCNAQPCTRGHQWMRPGACISNLALSPKILRLTWFRKSCSRSKWLEPGGQFPNLRQSQMEKNDSTWSKTRN